jgi:hypothetical protein
VRRGGCAGAADLRPDRRHGHRRYHHPRRRQPNPSGKVVFRNHDPAGVLQLYLWTPNQPNGTIGPQPVTLKRPANANGLWVAGINTSGQIAGYAEIVTGNAYGLDAAQIWGKNGIPTAFTNPAPSGKGLSQAFGINDSGLVVGDATVKVGSGFQFRSCLWKNGQMFDISNGVAGRAVGINSGGNVIGNWNIGGHSTPFLWTPNQSNGTTGKFTTLPFGYAEAINDAGQIAGEDNQQGPLLYTPGGGVQYLGIPSTSTSGGGASAVNNAARVVGYLYNVDASGVEQDHAYLWDAANGVRDLNDPARVTLVNTDLTPATGWVLNYAWGINDAGQISGYATDPTGQPHVFLLTPKP